MIKNVICAWAVLALIGGNLFAASSDVFEVEFKLTKDKKNAMVGDGKQKQKQITENITFKADVKSKSRDEMEHLTIQVTPVVQSQDHENRAVTQADPIQSSSFDMKQWEAKEVEIGSFSTSYLVLKGDQKKKVGNAGNRYVGAKFELLLDGEVLLYEIKGGPKVEKIFKTEAD